ncbi:MAG TPA: polymorphic toxin-type HINT domain-containing protein, partial [Polyangia bacterium]|nr:polymorphic toxin-type HINT domain-containing protein [Polyangia bacterium]
MPLVQRNSPSSNTRSERRRTRAAAATEYIVVAILIGISGVAIWSRLGPSAKCRMQVALQKFDSASSGETPISCDEPAGDGAGTGGAAPAPFTPPSAGGAGGSGASANSGGSNGDDNSAAAPAPSSEGESCPGGICTAPGNCFVAGTLVETEAGALPIERVTVGMRVLSRDQEGDAIDWKPVVHAFAHQTNGLVELTIGRANAPETIEVTPTHRVFAKGRGWVGVDALTPGSDELVDADGHDVDVLAAVSIAADVTVYNFEVADYHTYYVGAHSFWAHNTCPHGNDYHCYTCGESPSGNLTGPPPPQIVYVAPS